MKKVIALTTLLVFIVMGPLSLQAQPMRNGMDVIWARDVAGSGITLDGSLGEAVWGQAEKIVLRWENDTFYAPGGGWDDFFTSFSIVPTDPVDATVSLLRDGNLLWIGVEARDKSVGGSKDFFRHDGIVLSILNKTRRTGPPYSDPNNFNGANTDEFFFTWLAVEDTTAKEPGGSATLFGNLGSDRTVWDGRVTVDGMTNEDATEDGGYTMELWMDVTKLGIDFTDGDGDRLPMTFGVYDYDYAWPADPAQQFLSRAWWQNPWGGDMPHGVGFVYGRPDVTVGTVDLPALEEPEMRLPTAPGAVVTLDGALEEAEWQALAPQVSLQYQPSLAQLDALPAFGPYYTHWFRPGYDPAVPVVDPTEGRIRMFVQGTTLYVSLDTDDQAISGDTGEDKSDGVRVIVRSRTNDKAGLPYLFRGYRVAIDSTGSAVLLEDAAGGGVEAAVHLKGSSTAADPSDIDQGYQIELAIDLTTVPGYESGLGDGLLWLGAAYFDGDYLDPTEQSYGMRTWWLVERGGSPFGGPAAMAYVDPALRVSNEKNTSELPRRIELLGNYPNPFNPATRIVYGLPQAGKVSIEVYDVLGRRVAQLTPGIQVAGRHEVTFDASHVASGVYFYRIHLAGKKNTTATGRMMLVK